jgi:hypothetical protein
MNEARQKILQMLEDGIINAQEASRLLEALAGAPEAGEIEAESPVSPEPSENKESGVPVESPDMDRLRQFWQIPFFVSVGVLTLSGIGLGAVYATTEGRATVGFVCLWSVLVLASLAVALSFWSRTARWLHVRIRESEGHRFAISLPFPVRFAQWGIGLARRYADEGDVPQLDMASAFLEAVEEEMARPDAQPLLISVIEENGDSVQVFLS